MKRTMILALMLASGCVSEGVSKKGEYVSLKERPPRPFASRPIVAVVDFVDKTSYGEGKLGNGASSVLTTELSKTNQVRLVTREQLDKVLQELKLQHSGITDPATAASVGKVLNAKYIIKGDITAFGNHEVRSGVFVFSRSKTYVARCEVDAQLIDVQTAEILYAQNGNGEADLGATATVLGGSSVTYDPMIANKALRAAIVQMLDELMDRME